MSDTENITTIDEFDPFAVVILIRWLKSDVKAPDGKSHSFEKIADEILGVNRHTLYQFLQRKINHDKEKLWARDYAHKLKLVLDQGRPFPPTIRNIYESVYGDVCSLELDNSKPVQLPEVVRHRAMAHVPREPANIKPLLGLSVLIRLSNESVPAPELGDGASLPGWSSSVLNVLPDHVQCGLNHPLFTLSQRGLNSNSTLTVNGIVITQNDRFVFQGIDTLSRRPFHAYLRIPDEWASYRDNSEQRPIFGSGMMMGLSSGGNSPFAGLFEVFAIPDKTLENTGEEAKAGFNDLYRTIIGKSIGVRNLEDTVMEMVRLGIPGDTEALKSVIRTLRDRVASGRLLKP